MLFHKFQNLLEHTKSCPYDSCILPQITILLNDIFLLFHSHINHKTTYTDPRLAFAIEEKDGKSREIKQRFDAGSSALQVLQGRDLTGQYVIITGANTGIG